MTYYICVNNGVRLAFGELSGKPVYEFREPDRAAKFADLRTAKGFQRLANLQLDPGPGVLRQVSVVEVEE